MHMLPLYTGANHAFFNHANEQLSLHNKVIELLKNDRLINKLAIIMYLRDEENFNKIIVDVVKHKKYYLETYGSHLAITQTASVGQLFNLGVRYFHVHVEYFEELVYVTNSLKGGIFDKYLMKLCKAMNENRGEIVILHVEKTLYGIDTLKFDNYVEHVISTIAGLYNVSIYSPADSRPTLSKTRIQRILATNARLVVVYPRRTRLFWKSEECLDFSESYAYSLRSIDDDINNRYRGDDSDALKVVKAAVTSDLAEHVTHFTDTDYVDLMTFDTMWDELSNVTAPEKGIANHLKKSTSLKRMVLSVNAVNRETTLMVLRYNGNTFINNL